MIQGFCFTTVGVCQKYSYHLNLFLVFTTDVNVFIWILCDRPTNVIA